MKKKPTASMQRKLFLVYSLFVLVILVVGIAFISVRYSRESYKSYCDVMDKMSIQMDNVLKNNFDIAIRASNLYAFRDDVVELLGYSQEQFNQDILVHTNVVKSALKSSLAMTSNVVSGLYYTNDHQIYAYPFADEPQIQKLNEGIEKLVSGEANGLYISSVYESNASSFGQQSVNAVTIVRETTSASLKPLGYTQLTLNVDKILSNVLTIPDMNGTINTVVLAGDYIVFNDNGVTVSNDREMREFVSDETMSSENFPDQVAVRRTVNGEEYLFYTRVNERTGWKIVQYIPMSTVNAPMSNSIYVILGTSILILIAIVLFNYYLSQKLIAPLNRLSNSMRNLELDKLVPMNESDYVYGETKNLAHSFNLMILRLDDSLKRVYVAEASKRTSEIKMLHAQINPHFLYNTLNLINSLALLNGVPEIGDVITKLGDMFRYSIKSAEFVSLEDELKQIEDYIYIQKMRYPEKIVYESEIDSLARSCIVPKFILQPFVENAIVHGIESKSSQGRIGITAQIQDEVLWVCVYDNGKGFQPEKLEEVRQLCDNILKDETMAENRTHIGMANVYARIKCYYGDEYGCTIQSERNVRTEVLIKLPVCFPKKEENLSD